MFLLRPGDCLRAWMVGALVLLGCATGEDPERDSWSQSSGGSSGTTGEGGTAGSATGGTGGTGGGVAGSAGTGGTGGSAGSGGTGGGAGGTGGTGGTGGVAGSAGTGGTGGVAGSAGTGGTGGVAGSAGTGGTGGVAGSAGTSGAAGTGGTASATCSDGIQNQGETGIDCGGPCPTVCPTCADGIKNQGETGIDCGGPCPACGFTHNETFNSLPTWGVDGAYTRTGTCHASDSSTPGWWFTNDVDESFTQGTGYYARIDTDSVWYIGLNCDDYLISPMLATNGSSTVTIEFDTVFETSNSQATVQVALDGITQEPWTTTANVTAQRVTIGPINVAGKSQLRVLWRYEGMYDYHWLVDNILIKGI